MHHTLLFISRSSDRTPTIHLMRDFHPPSMSSASFTSPLPSISAFRSITSCLSLVPPNFASSPQPRRTTRKDHDAIERQPNNYTDFCTRTIS
jgi:hypothetical protein